MKEKLSVFEKVNLDNMDELWTAFERLGCLLGNTIGKGIDWFFDAIESRQVIKSKVK